MLIVSPEVRIRLSELEFSYVRSSGPGGQNVNKVNSKALLRWNLLASQSISLEVQTRLIRRLREKLSSEDCIVITSDRFRDQIRNREDCIEKLRKMLQAALVVPKVRKKSKPSKSSQRRLKETKSKHSQKKRLRRIQHSLD
jgi:ribosome-associated protein